MFKKNISLIFLLTLCGCMIGPNYKRPSVPIPDCWRFDYKEACDVINTAWWKQFRDTVLDALITESLKGNNDVKIAAARIEQYKGILHSTRAALFPNLGGDIRPGISNVPGFSSVTGTAGTPGFGGTGTGARSESALAAAPSFTSSSSFGNASFFAIGDLNTVWNTDLWGRIRRATEAARANLLSTREAKSGVVLTLVTSVAGAYVNLRSLDSQLEIARKTADLFRRNYDLFTYQFDQGYISELELNQAKAQYDQALSTIPVIETQIAQQEDALSILLGKNPEPIPRGKSIDQLILPVVPEGLPSSLLANRPDIRQAEQNLIAANAQIGAAKAQYFPDISLTGFLGIISSNLANLISNSQGIWSVTAPITFPIFNAGAIAGHVKSAGALKQQALITYQQVIQTAFREVDDALIDQSKTREQLDAQNALVESLGKVAYYARLRFEKGYFSYTDVGIEEVTLFQNELSLIQTKGHLFTALVNLYAAMGGGWVVKAEGETGVKVGKK